MYYLNLPLMKRLKERRFRHLTLCHFKFILSRSRLSHPQYQSPSRSLFISFYPRSKYYSPNVCLSAASTDIISEQILIALSIYESRTVTILSVIITEFVINPVCCPSDVVISTNTRLGCPVRARLLVIIATIVCDKLVPIPHA